MLELRDEDGAAGKSRLIVPSKRSRNWTRPVFFVRAQTPCTCSSGVDFDSECSLRDPAGAVPHSGQRTGVARENKTGQVQLFRPKDHEIGPVPFSSFVPFSSLSRFLHLKLLPFSPPPDSRPNDSENHHCRKVEDSEHEPPRRDAIKDGEFVRAGAHFARGVGERGDY